jgi:hypothetical protein
MTYARSLSWFVAIALPVSATWLASAAVIPAAWETVPLASGHSQAQPPVPAPATPTPPALPRCDRPEHRQFDYWVGDWDVRPNGQPATAPTPLRNVIRLLDDGCVLTEDWTTPRMTGRSVNIFDRSRGQWHQTWVDSTGGLHEYWGAANAVGDLVFHGSTPVPAAGNARQTVRLTFFNLGPDRARPERVRQFSEVLGSDGRWTTNYDLVYYRRPATR